MTNIKDRPTGSLVDAIPIDRTAQYIYHPVTGSLTTDGIQWTTWTETTGTPTTKSTNYVTPITSTLEYPGLSGWYIHELEAALTLKGLSTGLANSSMSTLYYRMEYRDTTGITANSSWQTMSTFKKFKSDSSTAVERTLSGYASLGKSYNRMPMAVRLRCYSGSSVKKSKFAVKNSSYFAVKVKKSS